MYLETLQKVLSQTDKVILDSQGGGSGAIPYLPLNELRGSRSGSSSRSGGSNNNNNASGN